MLLKLSDAQSAQRTTEDATKCCKSRCALGWVESKTSRTELRHPQLNLIKSTHGVGLRFELGFLFMNEIVKGLGNGDGETKMRPRRNVMKS